VPLSGLLLLLAAGMPARAAEITYKIQPLAKAGDTIGGVRITSTFSVSALNDHGALAFAALATPGTAAVFSGTTGPPVVITPVVVGGGQGPSGSWPKSFTLNSLVSINQQGDIAFTLDGLGVYLWSTATKQFTPVATVGMPATAGLTFTTPTINSPSLNNRGEVEVGMSVKDAAGKVQTGIFLHNAEGKLLPVALAGQALPDGSTIEKTSGAPTLNDAGVAGFFATRPGNKEFDAYLWEQGTITPVALIGAALPGGTKITHVSGLRVNNHNREALVALAQSDSGSAAGLYRYRNGQLTPLLLPGADLPGGGKFATVRQVGSTDGTGASTRGHISRANELGQYAFVATLEGGGVGVYLLDGDGKLSRILQTGMTTELGPITSINPDGTVAAAVGLNSQGQVVLSVKIANGPETLVLLTPTTP
jgi:hypothetical protein